MNKGTQTKDDIVRIMCDNAVSIKALGVKRLGLFGSFVRREQTTGSDVDILVEFDPGRKTFDNFMQLSFLLEGLLGREIELLTPESLNRHIGNSILDEVEYVPLPT